MQDNIRRSKSGNWARENIYGSTIRHSAERAKEARKASHSACASAEPPARALVYRSLFVQARGVLKKELLSHLRSKRSMRRSKPVDPNGDRRGHIKDIDDLASALARLDSLEAEMGLRRSTSSAKA